MPQPPASGAAFELRRCTAVAEPWSNGPVEGQINHLKLIQRQIFGRAGFDLLRQRVLHAA